jgi:hypothetical protein
VISSIDNEERTCPDVVAELVERLPLYQQEERRNIAGQFYETPCRLTREQQVVERQQLLKEQRQERAEIARRLVRSVHAGRRNGDPIIWHLSTLLPELEVQLGPRSRVTEQQLDPLKVPPLSDYLIDRDLIVVNLPSTVRWPAYMVSKREGIITLKTVDGDFLEKYHGLDRHQSFMEYLTRWLPETENVKEARGLLLHAAWLFDQDREMVRYVLKQVKQWNRPMRPLMRDIKMAFFDYKTGSDPYHDQYPEHTSRFYRDRAVYGQGPVDYDNDPYKDLYEDW